MKIELLGVAEFRSLKDVAWHPGDLNVVIGPNGAGKSNLLRVLELISMSAQGRLSNYVRAAGGMEPLVWDGQAEGIKVSMITLSAGAQTGSTLNPLAYEFTLARVGISSSYRVGREVLERLAEGPNEASVKLIERVGQRARIFDDTENPVTADEDAVPEEETLLSIAAGPFAVNRLIPLYQRELAAWSIYHDLNVSIDAPIRLPVVSKLERRVSPDVQNLVNVLHTLYTGDRDFRRQIDSGMRAAFGSDFEELAFPPAADQRVQLRVRWKSLRTARSASDLSDGTLRFLFLLTVLASPAAATLIAIDEPETGLHPSMLPIIAEYAIEASRKSQIIFTTHSPSFLDTFRETVPTTTIASWENGQTSLVVKSGEQLREWIQAYSLGQLLESGDLEAMA